MTTDYRAMCAELLAALESEGYAHWSTPPDEDELCLRARALLDKPVAEGPSDEEIEEWADACPDAPSEEMDPEIHGWRRCFTAKEFSETIRAAIAHWGYPTPQPPANGEVAELAEWLRNPLKVYGALAASDSAGGWLNRAADLLARPTPQPVALSERLPEPEDCDAEGRCWMFGNVEGDWRLISTINPGIPRLKYCFSHWLPSSALPTPEAQ